MKKIALLLFVSLVSSFLLAVFILGKKSSHNTVIDPIITSNKEHPTDVGDIPAIVENDSKIKTKNIDAAADNTSLSRVGRILEVARLSNIDLEFYGQVVDELDRPVANAVVVAGYTRGAYSSSRGEREVTTDKNGQFRLSGYGQGISIVDVKGENLSKYTVIQNSDNGIYRTHTLRLQGSHFKDSEYLGSSATNPMKIVVSLVAEYNDVQYGSMSRSGSITVDAESISNQDFGLQFICERETLSEDPWYEVGTWRAVLSPVGGGGFQRAKSAYVNQAPEDGYEVNKIALIYEFGGENYKKSHSFHNDNVFFYYSASENSYGVFSLNKFSADYSDKTCRVHFNFIKINRENKRNLALRRYEENTFTR